MTELRPGQWVKVSYEAEYVTPPTTFEPGHYVRVPDGPVERRAYVPPTATLEPIEDLRPGDIYRDESGDVGVWLPNEYGSPWLMVHLSRDSRAVHSGDRAPDQYMTRPLTLLVRDGKLVPELPEYLTEPGRS